VYKLFVPPPPTLSFVLVVRQASGILLLESCLQPLSSFFFLI
jgi:hypothetical protein